MTFKPTKPTQNGLTIPFSMVKPIQNEKRGFFNFDGKHHDDHDTKPKNHGATGQRNENTARQTIPQHLVD